MWWCITAQLVATFVGSHSQQIGEHQHPVPRREARLQDERLVEVAAGGASSEGRPDGPVAGVLVKQPAEDGG
jgi:hypothetical protein